MNADKRTEASLAFQARWSDLRSPGTLVPKSSDIELTHFAEFLPLLIKVEANLAARTMPILLVGSLIREIVGKEFTGKNFLDFVESEDEELDWKSRLLEHDHPCGRYEIVTMNFPENQRLMGSLTSLPMIGSAGERFFLVFGEPMEQPPLLERNQTAGTLSKTSDMVYFDIGAGIPELQAMEM